MRSYDAVKLSADSLEVPLQDSNIFLNFRDDFRFLWAPASTLLLQLRLGFALGNSLRKAKNRLMVKKSRFFKVSDTFTIISLRKKKHLTKFSSWLKRFYDHLESLRDNFEKLIMLQYGISFLRLSLRNCCVLESRDVKLRKN